MTTQPNKLRFPLECYDQNWLAAPALRTREEAMRVYSEAESRLGCFVNLDEDKLQTLMKCPPELLNETATYLVQH
jgi:hypothetical protein